jgi:lipopolysaccharide export system protein LptA
MAIKISGTTVIDDSRQLNATGVSTIGNVQISAGIVTANSGIVTYYGDGSELSGIVAFDAAKVFTYSQVFG